MAYQRYLIAPMEGGLQTDLKSWLIPEDAFEEMNNVYTFRGRVRKRFGSRLMNSSVALSIAQLSSRLRVQVGTIGAPVSPVPGVKFNVGSMFSAGSQMFTVYQTGTPAAMLATGPGTGTFNTTTGAFVLASTGLGAGTAIYYYPAQPVMGFVRYQTLDSTADPTYAFDTQFAYQFTGGAWSRLGTGIWTGTDSDFFWGATWRGALASDRLLFVTNNVAADGLQYWNGATWATLAPLVTAGTTLQTCLMIVVYKNYLIALNTTETGVVYKNRARWARIGSPLDVAAWRGDLPGNGNALDAATLEEIISCGFIKDQLIVYFERSTWTLKYTNNDAMPFTWQKVNTELGAESTFSAVAFDKVLLGIGATGIHACTGTNVERIDQKIPDIVWDIHTGSTIVDRVAGIRDFFVEQVYWTFPAETTNSFSSTFPNKVLVYNYKTGTWAFNDDSITCFGYYYAATQSAITWASLDVTWDNNEVLWSSGAAQPLNQDIIAGNQEGYTFIIDSDVTTNAAALQITNITLVGGQVNIKAINHNLNVAQVFDGDYVSVHNLNGLTGTFANVYPVISITDADNFLILAPDIYTALNLSQVYTGGGTVARVSIINFLTKQFNFSVQDDRNSYIQKVDCLVDRTQAGEITVDYQTSSSSNGTIEGSVETGAIVGNNVLETTPYALYPLEQSQERLWHPVYLQSDGTSTQLRFYLSNTQMTSADITSSDFQLHALCLYVISTSSRLQ